MIEAQYGCFSSLIMSELMFRSGQCLVYLSPYSPDFNPAEGFSAMKAWIRCNREDVLAEMTNNDGCDAYGILWQTVVESMTPKSIAGWYHNSGILM
jgi:hypothetical protein